MGYSNILTFILLITSDLHYFFSEVFGENKFYLKISIFLRFSSCRNKNNDKTIINFGWSQP